MIAKKCYIEIDEIHKKYNRPFTRLINTILTLFEQVQRKIFNKQVEYENALKEFIIDRRPDLGKSRFLVYSPACVFFFCKRA